MKQKLRMILTMHCAKMTKLDGKTIGHSANGVGKIGFVENYIKSESHLTPLNMKEKKEEDINAKRKHRGITMLSLMGKDLLRKYTMKKKD